ncbi:MAG: energy transducer TonB [Desulfobacteraceae bacterium]|nr:MAG: energy transducer TonB [Desulfobacteraceae bacterium]
MKIRSILGWALALIGSIALNLTLFGLMPGLIRVVPERPDDLEELNPIQVIRVKRPEPVVKKKPKKEIKKPVPEKQTLKRSVKAPKTKPLMAKPKLSFKLNSRLPVLSTDLVMPDLFHFDMAAPTLKDIYFAAELDSPLIPLVKIPPVYPRRASRRGIEGWVTVTFKVTRKGLVEDVRVIETDPEDIFNTAVINCVSKWKFKPGTVEGVAVAAIAQTTVRFNLEK